MGRACTRSVAAAAGARESRLRGVGLQTVHVPVHTCTRTRVCTLTTASTMSNTHILNTTFPSLSAHQLLPPPVYFRASRKIRQPSQNINTTAPFYSSYGSKGSHTLVFYFIYSNSSIWDFVWVRRNIAHQT